jgi:ion channel POLLUX/CASTOR
MSEKAGFRDRLNYLFDNFMSRGTLALIGGLAVLSLIVILIAASIITLGGKILAPEGSGPLSFFEAAWESLMRTFDAGTMGGDAGWGFRLVMLFVTVGGIFVVSTLIGVLTTGVEGKLEELRKGRSRVLESGHTLILGWSPQIFTIISELITANENQKNARIVILAEKDKVDMEDELRERVQVPGRTRIICRSGNPVDQTDLEIASPHAARSIIVLPPDVEDSDSYVIKTILALTNNPNRKDEPYQVVTQIRDPRDMEVLKMVSPRDRILPILSGDLIARVVAQTSRQSGLSVVYTELLNFGGDEIYFKEEPLLVGKTFGECLSLFEDSSLIGIQGADGALTLKPPMDERIEKGDRIIAISADDDTIRLSNLPSIPLQLSSIKTSRSTRKPKPEKCLVLGWNRPAGIILRELDAYVTKGSLLKIIVDERISAEAEKAQAQVKTLARQMKNQKVVFINGDTTDRNLLEKLDAASFDHIIVLSYAGLEIQEADSKTLITLLHLRDIAEKDETPFSIVSEMLDLRNRELAEVAHVDDFIVSEHLVSLMMAQLSENAELAPLFADIFDPEGSEIYLKPVGDYVETGVPVNFYTVVEAARRRDQVAFGYRLAQDCNDKRKSYGVCTNPRKSQEIIFSPDDRIVVVAEE